MYKAAGHIGYDIENKLQIGISNTFFEGFPGTDHLRTFADPVKTGGISARF